MWPGPPPWPAGARVCASAETALRLWPLVEHSGRASIESVLQPPANAAEWLRDYEGAYVLVSQRDRVPFYKALNILGAQSRGALASFPLTLTVCPDRTRLGAFGVWLGLYASDPAREYRIDVHHVAARDLAVAPSSCPR